MGYTFCICKEEELNSIFILQNVNVRVVPNIYTFFFFL